MANKHKIKSVIEINLNDDNERLQLFLDHILKFH